MTAPAPGNGPVVVAIDGPAGSGKSTLGRSLSEALGGDWAYLDTGAMYRAITVVARRRGVALDRAAEVASLARGLTLRVDPRAGRVWADGEEVTADLRTAEVNETVSVVAAIAAVREVMRAHQRRFAADHGRVVAEGRDMGTAVFPDAAVKVFLVAHADERVRRRVEEMRESHPALDPEDVRRALLERDRLDSGRAVNPLARADDAVAIDTTGLSPAEVLARVRALVVSRLPPVAGR